MGVGLIHHYTMSNGTYHEQDMHERGHWVNVPQKPICVPNNVWWVLRIKKTIFP
jgi:hypothetical protein